MDLASIVYLSPTQYASTTKDIFNPIYRNQKYKEICVRILRLFDENIQDIVLLRDDFGQPMDCLRSKSLGILPVSNYGDGVKRVLSIAGALAQAHDGILLIDEFETAIHAKNYNDIFNFLDKASEEYDIQLFLTTYSIEAVDELLKVDNAVKEGAIRFITLRKEKTSGKTLYRMMDGTEVMENREKFDFEVRL